MATRTIAVVGATGGQGGGLARAIAADESGEFAAHDPEIARRLNPQLQTFSQWLERHADQIQIG